MTILFADGFDTQTPQDVYTDRTIDDGGHVVVEPVTGGRNSGYRLSITAEGQDNHERGVHVPVSMGTDPDLWVGFNLWNDETIASRSLRVVVIYIDSTAVLALMHQGQGTVGIRLNPDMTGAPTHDETYDYEVESESDDIDHLILHVHRDSDGGYAEIYVDAELVLTTSDIPGLATTAGDLDKVLFNCRNDNTSSTTSTLAYLDDCWIADENLGDAFIVVATADSDGNHQDGTLSTGTDGFALVNDTPFDDATFITLAAADRRSFGYDTSNLTAVSAGQLAAIVIEPSIEGNATAGVFARQDATDRDLDDVTVSATEVKHAPLISEINPYTFDRWTPADLDDAEFGVEG